MGPVNTHFHVPIMGLLTDSDVGGWEAKGEGEDQGGEAWRQYAGLDR